MARTFGVEIECVMENAQWEKLREKLPGWEISTDGSVSCGGYEGEYCGGGHDCNCDYCGWYDDFYGGCDLHIGAEIKTPILEGTAGYRELKKGFRVLNEAGATVNRTCGMHVHHGGRDLTMQQIVRLLKVWDANRNTIEQMVDSERIGGEYSWQMRPYYLEQLDSLAEQGAVAINTLCGWFHHGCEVNVGALQAHGTIEFRLHHGTMDYDEAEAWVRFGQGLIADVVGKNKVGDYEVPVAEFLDHTCSTKKAKEILAAKIERRTARLAAPRA